MTFRRNILLFFVIISAVPLWAGDVTLYMVPTAVLRENTRVLLQDVVTIHSPAPVKESLLHEEIPSRFLVDGFLNRSELAALMKKKGYGNVVIYGSSCRILKSHGESIDRTQGPLVKRGQRVTVVLRNRNIVVEIKGTAMENGNRGETIKIRVNPGRCIRGIVEQNANIRVEM
jgi:hypothetical protein